MGCWPPATDANGNFSVTETNTAGRQYLRIFWSSIPSAGSSSARTRSSGFRSRRRGRGSSDGMPRQPREGEPSADAGSDGARLNDRQRQEIRRETQSRYWDWSADEGNERDPAGTPRRSRLLSNSIGNIVGAPFRLPEHGSIEVLLGDASSADASSLFATSFPARCALAMATALHLVACALIVRDRLQQWPGRSRRVLLIRARLPRRNSARSGR